MNSPVHAKRAIKGILDSYNSNYDALAEAVQNSMDAIEDAILSVDMPGPYLLDITVDLKENTVAIFDTGIGMSQDQVCQAFAPTTTFKDIPAKIRQRGDKNPYRGYKGVGLTFLAYGTNDVLLQSRQDGSVIVKGRMKYGRDWVEDRYTDGDPILNVDDSQTPLDAHQRGTYLRMLFSPQTRPQSLLQIGREIEIWEAILRTRTAVGQIRIGDKPVTQIKVTLNLIGTDGVKSTKEIVPEFYYPHLVVKRSPPPFQFLDIGKYFEDHKNEGIIQKQYKERDAVYFEWDTEEIRGRLEEPEKAEFEAVLNDLSPCLYAFRPHDEPDWKLINDNATGQKRGKFFGPGLVIGVNHQRIASEAIRVQPSRSEYLASNVFVLVHFKKAILDQGRKTLQPHVMDLAQKTADDAIQLLLKQKPFLKQAGDKTDDAQRQVELDHESWLANVNEHARLHPLSAPPLCYTSTPIMEQDVIGLFNQLAALGLFPGLKIHATSAGQTYDCYVRFDCREDAERLRYVGVDNNPLGLSHDVLGPTQTHFRTKGLTLEFKNNLLGLIGNLEAPDSPKTFNNIDICVCWESLDEPNRWYTADPITEDTLRLRKFPGVTHLLRKDDESQHTIQVIALADIMKMVASGNIRLQDAKAENSE